MAFVNRNRPSDVSEKQGGQKKLLYFAQTIGCRALKGVCPAEPAHRTKRLGGSGRLNAPQAQQPSARVIC